MLYLVSGVVAFFLILWITGKMAGVMEAGRPGMSWAFVAFFCSGLLGVLFGLSGLIEYPIIYFVVVTLMTIIIFAFIFQLNFVGALVTYIVSSGVSGVSGFLLVMVFGIDAFSGMRDDEVVQTSSGLEEIAIAAEEVCRCGEDVACLGQKNKRFMAKATSVESHLLEGVRADSTLKRYMQRAMHCQMQPAPYDPSKSVVDVSVVALPEASDAVSVPMTVPVDENDAVPPSDEAAPADTMTQQPLQAEGSDNSVQKRMDEATNESYEEITFFEAPVHVKRKVHVTRHDGKVIRGVLVKVEGEFLYLKRRDNGGGHDYMIAVSDIKSLAVLKKS